MNAVRSLTVATLCALVGGLLFGNATPTFAAEPCPNEQLRAEQPYGLGLPDCRAYEMVSPLSKNGGEAITLSDPTFAPFRVRSSVSGEAFTFNSQASFANPGGNGYTDQYVSRRGPDGWSTQNITAPIESDGGAQIVQYPDALFTPELSEGVLENANPPLTSEAPDGYFNDYVANFSDDSYETVTNVAPPGIPPDSFEYYHAKGLPWVAGASTDLSHVVFVQYASLTPKAPAEAFNLYEWMGGNLTLINVTSEGTPIPGGAQPGGGEPHAAITAGNADEWHAVSENGSRVFFTAQLMDEEEEEAISERGGEVSFGGDGEARAEEEEGRIFRKPQLYERVLEPSPKTVEVSASQKTNGGGPGGTDPNGPQAAFYWGANAEGSKVLFTSRAELTDDANTGGKDNAANLYEYDLETGHLSDLSVDTNPADTNGAEILGVVDESEDGSYVYFVAEGVLTSGPASGEPTPVSGEPNLYVSHDGSTTFIATLSPSDRLDWSGQDLNGEFSKPAGGTNEWAAEVGPANNRGGRITPDGTRLAFLSSRSLTGYDNQPVEAGECEDLYEPGVAFYRYEPGPCAEVYIYDAPAHSLSCVSCNPSGAQPIGASGFGIEEQRTAFYITRNFSEDSSRLFFDSRDALTPHTSDGRQNVYEYENGHLYALSNTAGGQESLFLDASANGDDVFIATSDQLLPEDRDNLADVYDVRVDGGSQIAVASPVCDNGDSCKPPAAPQPAVFGAPASATFSGTGNVVAPLVSKPLVKARKPKPKTKKKKVKKKKKGKAAKKAGGARRVRAGVSGGGVKRS